MSKILSLDYGTMRIGVALSDETGKIAFARAYVLTQEKEKILDIIKNEQVNKVLLGLPKTLSGEEGNSAEQTREFADWLKQRSGVEIKLIDERFSSKEVEKLTKDRDLIDSLVAQKMLERYLNSNS